MCVVPVPVEHFLLGGQRIATHHWATDVVAGVYW